MSENRDYISYPDEMGTIHIADEVLAVVAASAALEVEGVSSLAANLSSDLAELMGKKVYSKGVRFAGVQRSGHGGDLHPYPVWLCDPRRGPESAGGGHDCRDQHQRHGGQPGQRSGRGYLFPEKAQGKALRTRAKQGTGDILRCLLNFPDLGVPFLYILVYNTRYILPQYAHGGPGR